MSHRHKAQRSKRYRPRDIDANPIELAINQAMRLLPTEQAELTQPMDAAFAEIRAGRGNLEHWARLADSLNIATALAHLSIASDHHATFEAGQQALSCLHERVESGGCWTLKGPEIAALDDALFIHTVQLGVCSRRELREAVTSVMHRVQQALAGNAASGVRVCLPGLLGRPEQLKAELVVGTIMNLSSENGDRRFLAIGADGQEVAPTFDEGQLKRRLKGYITEGNAADGVADAHA